MSLRTHSISLISLFTLMLMVGVMCWPVFAQAKEKSSAVPVKTDAASSDKAKKRAALEKKFQATMQNATLVGSFTLNDKKNKGKLHQEKYTLGKVEKYNGDFWTITARITYGKHDLNVPLLLEVKWAGDTPVITGDNFKIPGMGSFTFRVLIHNGQYIGTWDAGDHGGQMFGKIVHEAKKDKAKAE
jgi:hypothetical protein